MRTLQNRSRVVAAGFAVSIVAAVGLAGAVTGSAAPNSATHGHRVLSTPRAVHLGFDADQLVLGGNTVYAFSAGRHGHTTVAEVDVASHRVVHRVNLPGVVYAASLASGRLLVLTQAHGGRLGRHTTLLELDAATQQVVASRKVHGVGDVIARSGGIFVTRPSEIDRLSPSSLKVNLRIPVRTSGRKSHIGGALAADPRASILFDGIGANPSGKFRPMLDIISLRKQKVVARSMTVGGQVGPLPYATGRKAWNLSFNATIGTISLVNARGKTRHSFSGGYESVALSGKRLWTEGNSDKGKLALSCRSLATGHKQGSAKLGQLPDNVRAFAADDSHVYLSRHHELRIFTPEGACA